MISIGVAGDMTVVELIFKSDSVTTTIKLSYEAAYLYADLLDKCANVVENRLESEYEPEGEVK